VSRPDVLAGANLHPFYRQALDSLYTVHDRTHETDPQAFAALAPRILGVAGTGEALVPGSLLRQLPQARVVSVFGVGYDGVDVAAAIEQGIPVTHTPGVLTDDVADLAMGLVLAVGRQIALADQFVRAGRWPQGPLALGRKVSGARMGIVGMGRIGQALARRSMGFNMKVIYNNRSRLAPELEAEANNARHVSREELLRTADHVVLVLPYSKESHHLIGAAELALMKPTATLINIARGGIVDDAALIEALSAGKIAAAGLDVFENEPAFNPGFLKLSNVVLTPHIGSASGPTRRAMADCAADNLIAALSGHRPPNLLNPESFKQ
jgi:lactate dehydrogenase-like 2-hydroxyacid dehydrogenase